MSDIGIDLSGVIALFIFLLAAVAIGICGLISLIIAFVTASKNGRTVKAQRAFAYFWAAVPLVLLNLIVFGMLAILVDSNSRETNETIDRAAGYVWLPLQSVMWIGSGLILNKLKK